ncbi:monoxygenase, putative [Talaromyces stipitatus ATCC 10500]|uniref:Monoxygenase, putative n=1 Tax=Talaromyces stipitatus (strain ATCC 10500 / CBS 375.48 / QM 6759 / NRRL 1006) TaxID=441959 RepID=B8LV98_TALSN|nr:monooxygenase, putative [Talaromyces stipitatus ATCC 10500]EED23148.1 monoxygenase, putative [Talaromyces stipitatus ATCC 10500]
MSAAQSAPHVLIIGGGLGGLALAQILRKQGISFEVFERDLNKEARPTGWAIGLHSIIDELESAVPNDLPPLEPFVNHLQPLTLPAQLVFYTSPNLAERFGVENSPSTRIVRANRRRLRDWLRINIPIYYNKKLVRVDETEAGVTAHFEDGISATGDILIGADGIRSVVRQCLLHGEDIIKVAPVGNIIGELVLSDKDMIEQLQLGHSAWICNINVDDLIGVFGGVNEVHTSGKSGDYYWSVAWQDDTVPIHKSDYWTQTATKEELHSFAVQKVRRLPDKLRKIIEQTPVDGMKLKPILYYDVELNKGRIQVGRVMLLGDAAHSMYPFRGEGAIHALVDAMSIGRTISQNRGSIVNTPDTQRILQDCQDEILERGAKAVRASRAVYFPEKEKVTFTGPRMAWGHPSRPIPVKTISV